ncbi:hypothetical protein [Robiginitalea sp. SC105]|uniref:hypothetical protein n=1 Tax=Robiginitalea sp. SC105 TaxID=2762332 RepID=UPI00163AAF15|nr:hypothetical protein [Robiginitalea sp. SC105]MBC2838476.1 hypothetical protein [Robiginitalea sp. SC105]
MNSLNAIYRIMAGVLLLGCTGCASLRQEEDPYAETWESVVKSQDWKYALELNPDSTTAGQAVYFALPDWNDGSSAAADPEFVETYPKLVSRAYFRLIAEAMKADRRIRMSFQDLSFQVLNSDEKPSRKLLREYETARKRFVAHRQMLEGLLTWKAFNTYGSDDLEFFMREQLGPSLALYRKGAQQERILDFLMTELADLYHKPGEPILLESL